MPEKKSTSRARKNAARGKSASTKAGEFVREEMEDLPRPKRRGGKARKQAIAIGLSRARRAGVELPPPAKGSASEKTRAKAEKDVAAGRKRRASGATKKTSGSGRGATKTKRAPAKSAAKRRSSTTRTAAARSTGAKKAAKTKGPAKRSAAAKKAARTRAANRVKK